jgi:hypothetical protein
MNEGRKVADLLTVINSNYTPYESSLSFTIFKTQLCICCLKNEVLKLYERFTNELFLKYK